MVAPSDIRPRRILVVDDDPVLRTLLRMTLTKAGYEVVIADHGGHAAELLESETEPIDLVLLDLMMPVMDGLRLLQWLREQARTPALALVFSSFEGKTMSQRAVEAGAADYLTKPVQINTLLARVKSLLGS